MKKKIYLFCNGGMSTSILARKMQGVADEYKLPVEVTAYAEHRLEEVFNEKGKPDCILFGPQTGYVFESMKDNEKCTGIPMDIIDAGDYGMVAGEKILKKAVMMIKNNKK